jgi:hypothetical protein
MQLYATKLTNVVLKKKNEAYYTIDILWEFWFRIQQGQTKKPLKFKPIECTNLSMDNNPHTQ